MGNLISYILFGLAAVLACWVVLVWRGFTQEWLPPELALAKVFQVEKSLRVDEPFAVVGRPDQVYKLPNGTCVPIENKNRDYHRVYDSDVAQLSLQAWLLRRNGFATALYGFVVINARKSGQRRALRVALWNDEQCLQLVERYLDIIHLRVTPTKQIGPKCKSCGHRNECHKN